MTHDRIIAAVLEMPWAILPAKLEAIAEVLARRESGERYTSEQIESAIGARKESPEPQTFECFADGGIVAASGASSPRKLIAVLPRISRAAGAAVASIS